MGRISETWSERRRHANSYREYSHNLRSRSGKLASLGRIISDHYSSLEADWQRFYQRDLAKDLWGIEPLGTRKIANLIKWLPPEAAIWRSNETAWDTQTELQATTIEILDAILRTYLQVHSKPNSKKPKPIKIPRPWEKTEKEAKRGTTLNKLLSEGLKVKKIKKED
jgi:hypothetical protein